MDIKIGDNVRLIDKPTKHLRMYLKDFFGTIPKRYTVLDIYKGEPNQVDPLKWQYVVKYTDSQRRVYLYINEIKLAPSEFKEKLLGVVKNRKKASG